VRVVGDGVEQRRFTPALTADFPSSRPSRRRTPRAYDLRPSLAANLSPRTAAGPAPPALQLPISPCYSAGGTGSIIIVATGRPTGASRLRRASCAGVTVYQHRGDGLATRKQTALVTVAPRVEHLGASGPPSTPSTARRSRPRRFVDWLSDIRISSGVWRPLRRVNCADVQARPGDLRALRRASDDRCACVLSVHEQRRSASPRRRTAAVVRPWRPTNRPAARLRATPTERLPRPRARGAALASYTYQWAVRDTSGGLRERPGSPGRPTSAGRRFESRC